MTNGGFLYKYAALGLIVEPGFFRPDNKREVLEIL